MLPRSRIAPALLLAAITFVLAPAPAAEAQSGTDLGVRHVGIRGGVTVDPDQGHVGMHIDAGNFARRLRFQPSFEVGFGSDRTILMIHADALYTFDAEGWSPYLGGGLGIGIIGRDRRPGDDDVDVEAGVNVVGGFEWGAGDKYLLEARAGIGDIPDFKLTIGYNF